MSFTEKDEQQQQPANAATREEEEALSDVDARVLREMLQESKLDLQTEEDVKKLLDRGTKKKVTSQAPDNSRNDSKFDSTILQTLGDTKMWKAFSAKASDILESAQLWVSNEIERGVKTAAALGIFAWERAVRDVGRALPAAGTATKKIFLLANTSSFVEEEPVSTADSLREELNRPADEIKSVSRAIWEILNGDSVSPSGGRGLRTVAKAGTANMADRQQRAFKQSRKKRENEANIARGVAKIPGGIADATYELQRELKSEANPAGYKTKPIRKAIEAGVGRTGNILEGIKESARLAAAERKAKRLQAAQEETTTYDTNEVQKPPKPPPPPPRPDPSTSSIPASPNMPFYSIRNDDTAAKLKEERNADILLDLQLEREEMLDRLMACIEKPQLTWLQSELVTNEAQSLGEGSLREIATLMILLKDELNSTSATASMEETAESCLSQLRTDLGFVEQLRATVTSSISLMIGNTLHDIIVGKYEVFGGATPMLLRLDEVERALLEPVVIPPPPPKSDPEIVTKRIDNPEVLNSMDAEQFLDENIKFVEVEKNHEVPVVVTEGETAKEAYVLDVIPESVIRAQNDVSISIGDEAVVVDPETGSVFLAEVVSDNDFDDAVGEAKKVSPVSDDDDEEDSKPNIAVEAVLRSLDVVFFVLEKVFVVAVPGTISLVTNAAKRIAEVNEGGQGRKGWEVIRNTANPKGRY